ncbi:hypothetical protein [Endozoicomonas sp.]|uniref:hypothetical protein n=1 Tax=Endozoicomonas sp. TaxID=1892382 RepID=UPI003D9B8D7D
MQAGIDASEMIYLQNQVCLLAAQNQVNQPSGELQVQWSVLELLMVTIKDGGEASLEPKKTYHPQIDGN